VGTVANKLLSGTAKITLFSITLHYNNSFDDGNQAYFVSTVCYYIFINVLICDDSPRATAIRQHLKYCCARLLYQIGHY
jgi:hypothetical protein